MLFLSLAQVSAALPVFLATGVERGLACWGFEQHGQGVCVCVCRWEGFMLVFGCVSTISLSCQRRTPLAGFRCVYGLSNYPLYLYFFTYHFVFLSSFTKSHSLPLPHIVSLHLSFCLSLSVSLHGSGLLTDLMK